MKAEKGRLGVLAAIMLAVSAFAFFAIAAATTKAHPLVQPEQFLSDVTARPVHAEIWAWAQIWLGMWAVPFYLALHARLRTASSSGARIALVTGIMWGLVLVCVTPVLHTIVHDLAPAWVAEPDTVARAGLLQTAKTLLAIVATQITTVFLLRAVSVFAAGVAMIAEGTSKRLGWLGVAFAVEHFVAGVLHQTSTQGGVNSALGAVGGVMFTAWLVGTARLFWRAQPAQVSASLGEARS